MARKKNSNGNGTPMTTAQGLGSLLKSARDIMRKDKGLNGDLDRLPLLTWVMFLKFLDDLEQQRADEAKLAAKKFRAAIEPPYRWRDWAANPQGITGDELLAFINQDEARRPDGKRGPGLFAYLRDLSSANGDNRRDVIATVFRGVDNRMKSGYLLRDVINKVANIHFTSSDELHTLGALYESMLREMRDAAGDSGEFYTPRPVVQFMVATINPQLGETVLDPATGTGGFLVEAFNHLSKQVKTVANRKTLQSATLFGCEPKSLPYLLCQMNLLLHGIDTPQIDSGNALRFKLSEIGEKDRVDIILTNPPFGGEEEKGVQGNFPDDKQTSETALLFLQLIMRKLRRSSVGGRAAVIVPDGVLFDDGVARRIREELLRNFNLHTVVRLPEGVFAPYAKTIKTNILFFDRSAPTSTTWFFEHKIPEDRKTYSKTRPIERQHFDACARWWDDRKPSEQAWLVTIDELASRQYNLDVKNPAGFEELAHQAPSIVVSRLSDKIAKAQQVLSALEAQLQTQDVLSGPLVPIGDFATLVKRRWTPIDGESVKSLGVKWWGKGAYVSETKAVEELQAERFLVNAGDLIYNDMWARHGSVAIVPEGLGGCVASAHFPTWELDQDRIYRPYLTWCFRSPWFWAACELRSRGSTGRNAIRKGLFRGIQIPLPEVSIQTEIAARLENQTTLASNLISAHSEMEAELEAIIPAILQALFAPIFAQSEAAVEATQAIKPVKGDADVLERT
jgi:type I restriction enzyme M protein